MIAHCFLVITLLVSSFLSESKREASCRANSHFTEGSVEIENGYVECSGSKWGWPEIKVSEDAIIKSFQLTTTEMHKTKLEEFKSILRQSKDTAAPDILKQIALGEKLSSYKDVNYDEYKKFQKDYISTIDKLIEGNKEDLSKFFQFR